MKVRIRLFGALAERAGLAEEAVELAEGATAGDVLGFVAERYPPTEGLLRGVGVAVNLEIASTDTVLDDDDEVGLLPPVSGGGATILTGLREGSPSIDEARAAVAAPGAGGTALFLGTVRDHTGANPVERLEYTAYEEMAELQLRRVAEEAAERWSLAGVAILHAMGDLAVGDVTVVVACSAAHRADALEACRYAIDQVKLRVPIWKKEIGPGGSRWVGDHTEASE
jgi:molybdopterin synthase catalytic subunit/molybdopterin converting factor small subunit